MRIVQKTEYRNSSWMLDMNPDNEEELIRYREHLKKILDSDIYKIEMNYPVVIPDGPKNPKHFNIDHPPKIKTEVCQRCLGTGNIAIPVFSEHYHFPVLYEHEECPMCSGSGRRKQ